MGDQAALPPALADCCMKKKSHQRHGFGYPGAWAFLGVIGQLVQYSIQLLTGIVWTLCSQPPPSQHTP